MLLYERVASALIGTPLQGVAECAVRFCGLPHRLRHPELADIFAEGGRLRAVMARIITAQMNCIDVGCHLGSVLNEIVRLAPRGQHIAIEPLGYKAAWLRKKFPSVEVHESALGDRNETVEFFFDRRQSGYSGMVRHSPTAREVLRVPCQRLDDIVPPGKRIGFIKVDVEGCEYKVFQGACRVLRESKPAILFECTRTGLAALGAAAADVFNLLDGLGYRVYLPQDFLAGAPPLDCSQFADSMNYPFRAFNYVGIS